MSNHDIEHYGIYFCRCDRVYLLARSVGMELRHKIGWSSDTKSFLLVVDAVCVTGTPRGVDGEGGVYMYVCQLSAVVW